MWRIHPLALVTLALFSGLFGGLGWYVAWPEPTRAAAIAVDSECVASVPTLEAEVSPATVRRFTLVAAPSTHSPKSGLTLPVWVFNGSLPGPELRARQGDQFEITVCNGLAEPLALHWHGYPVANAVDGVPGLTQPPIQPGARFVYRFSAPQAGTYWYHSHHDGTLQVDRGLYGPLIVEPRAPDPIGPVDQDLSLVLADRFGLGAGPADLTWFEHGRHTLRQAVGVAPSAPITLNGRAFDAASPINARFGERLRLRFIHAGVDRHLLQIGGHAVRLVAVDGMPIANAPPTRDSLPLYPGQRIDLLVEADNPGVWTIRLRDSLGPPTAIGVVRYDGQRGPAGAADAAWGANASELDLATYAIAAAQPSDNAQPGGAEAANESVEDLREAVRSGQGRRHTLAMRKTGERYSLVPIDGDAPLISQAVRHDSVAHGFAITAKAGELVALTILNETGSADLHPMHTHGYHFQIIEANGRIYSGIPIWRDTINIAPRERVVVAFRADRPGDWLIHCHVLRHADNGLGGILTVLE